jgi:hypothetical protein
MRNMRRRSATGLSWGCFERVQELATHQLQRRGSLVVRPRNHPMRQVAGYRLWIGNAGDLRDPRTVLGAGIEAVVELADNEQLAVLPRDLIRLRFPLADGGANPDWLLRLAVNFVSALVKDGIPTLVCCSCGLNRSVCVAAAALASFETRPFDEVLLEVASAGPADVSPGLLAQFRVALSN